METVKKFVSFFLSIVCFISCNNTQNNLIENKYSVPERLSIKEISFVGTESFLLKDYFLNSSFKNDTINMFVGFNDKVHGLDFFDLNNTTTYQWKLQLEGPEGISRRVSGLYFHNMDSVWIYDETMNAFLLNRNGEIQNKISLVEDVDDFGILIQTNYAMSTSKLFYNKHRNSLLYTLVRYSGEDSEFYVCERFMQSEQTKKYKLSPSLVEKKLSSRYCNMRTVNVTFSDSLIIYNYPIESNIYTLNIYTDERKAWGGQSQYTENVVQKTKGPLNKNLTYEKHDVENVHFQEVSYLPEADCYVRIHFDSAEYVTNANQMDLIANKKIYIMFFNHNFEIINETELPQGRYSHYTTWLPLAYGFLIYRSDLTSEYGDDITSVGIFTKCLAD